MASIRDIRDRARLALHRGLQMPAFYIAPNGALTPCTVRVHKTPVALGDVKGTSFGYAERHEILPRVVFLAAEIAAPVRGAKVSLTATEAYEIDNVLPADGITITVEAVVYRGAALPWPNVYGPGAGYLALTANAIGEVG